MQSSTFDHFETVRTTVTLPANLIQRSQHFIETGQVPNRNSLIIAALEQLLAAMEREEIDRQFAAMAQDSDYQKLQKNLAEEFVDSDWEALKESEESIQ
ncbi:MAG: CopG family transcriptional regulator [Chloroflexi bacterium]|nr:CopG family transcriptional regulator [Chloroflexota bacterium]